MDGEETLTVPEVLPEMKERTHGFFDRQRGVRGVEGEGGEGGGWRMEGERYGCEGVVYLVWQMWSVADRLMILVVLNRSGCSVS